MAPSKTSLRANLLAAFRLRNRIGAADAPADDPAVGQRGPFDLVVASYNIHKCVGTDKRFDPGRIAEVICELDADLIALQEADQRFGARAGLLDLDRLRHDSRLVRVPVAGMTADGHGWHGNVLLIREGAVERVEQLRLPGVEPRGALMVDLETRAGPLRVICAHLGLLRRSRALQARSILDAMRNAEARPTVLIGDLNEWRVGRRSSLAHLAPVFDPMHAAVPSFPSAFPLLPLDRVLGHPHGLVRRVEVHHSPLSRVASDHLPIRAHIDMRQHAAAAVGDAMER